MRARVASTIIAVLVSGLFLQFGVPQDARAAAQCASLKTKVRSCAALKRHTSKHRRRRCSHRIKAYKRQCIIDATPDANPAKDAVCYSLYEPVCGQPAYYCPPGLMCTLNMPAPVTYSNSCVMRAAGAYLLYDGECQDPAA